MEGYNINPFTLSPSYAGIRNGKTLFIDYRSDLSGFTGSPVTCELSYSDLFKDRVGYGVRFIFDRTDIFKHSLILGTYSYKIKIADDRSVNFALSMGIYRNSIDMAKYYNDPSYIQDNILIYGQQMSKYAFATDISGLYRTKRLETGILFSNVMFGTLKYKYIDLTYKPFKNWLLHGSWLVNPADRLTMRPTIIVRGGQNIPVQLELSSDVTWDNKFWGMMLYRSAGVMGMGLGGEVFDGVILNYSYNVITNVSLYTFGTHQLSLGIRIPKLFLKDNTKK